MPEVNLFIFSSGGCFLIHPVPMFWWARKCSVGIPAAWTVTPHAERANAVFLLKINLMALSWAALNTVEQSVLSESFFLACPDTILSGSHPTSLTFLLSLLPLPLFFAHLLSIGVSLFWLGTFFFNLYFSPHTHYFYIHCIWGISKSVFSLKTLNSGVISIAVCSTWRFPWPRHV